MTDLDCITDDPRTEYAPDCPEDEYRDAVGLGSTDVRRLCDSVRAWRDYRESWFKPSDSTILGTYVHLAALQPSRWADEVLDYPEPPINANDLSANERTIARYIADVGRDGIDVEEIGDHMSRVKDGASYAEERVEESGILSLAHHIRDHGVAPDPELVETAEACADVIHRHLDAADLEGVVQGGDAEASFWWPVERGERYQCKGRADYVRELDDWIALVDLKTTHRTCKPGPLGKLVGDRRYHVQAAHYSEGLRETHPAAQDGKPVVPIYIFVETEPPHHAQVVRLDDESLHAGHHARDRAITRLDAWHARDGYDGYDANLHEISIPRYLKRRV